MNNDDKLYTSIVDDDGNTLITVLYRLDVNSDFERVLRFTKIIENSRFDGIPVNDLPGICEQVAVNAMLRGECDLYINPDVKQLYADRVRLPHEQA